MERNAYGLLCYFVNISEHESCSALRDSVEITHDELETNKKLVSVNCGRCTNGSFVIVLDVWADNYCEIINESLF